MKNSLLAALAATTLIGAITATPALALTPDSQQPQEEKGPKKQPFNGKVEAMDPTVQSLTVGGKVIYISSQTKLTKGGQAIALTDIKVGDQVHGQAQTTFDGKTEALTVKVGPAEKK